MRLFNTLKNKVDDLNLHSTDTYELCPHCNKRVHITKCRMPQIDKNEAKHYKSFEDVAQTLVEVSMKFAGANDLIAKPFGKYMGPKAQRGVEEATHLIRANYINLKKRETICPYCGKRFVYCVESIFKW